MNNLPGSRTRTSRRLTDNGLELLAEVGRRRGFSLLGHFTTISSKADDDAPVGDGYSSKVGGEVMWREAAGTLLRGL